MTPLRNRLRTGLAPIAKSLLIRKPFVHFAQVRDPLAAILTYHRVRPLLQNYATFAPNGPIVVQADEFRKQMAHLTMEYRCVPLSTLLSELREGKVVRQTVCLTFDDGYRDNLQYALPILEEYGVPASIFVTTGLIDRSVVPWWYELEHIIRYQESIAPGIASLGTTLRTETVSEKESAFHAVHRYFKHVPTHEQNRVMQILRDSCPLPFPEAELLTWDEVRRLHEHPLIEIGCHTHTHPVLSREREGDVRDDLRLSRQRLASELKADINLIAYPFGERADIGTREFSIAHEVGFSAGVTMWHGHVTAAHRSGMLALPRVNIADTDSFTEFRWKVSGWNFSRYPAHSPGGHSP